MEKNVNDFDSFFLFNQCYFCVEKGTYCDAKREKLKLNNKITLFDAANYFADLFLNYGREINCTSVKIQKLILLLQLYTIKKTDGKENFTNIKEILVAPCGCKIPEAEPYISSFFLDGAIENKPLDLTFKEKEELLQPKIHSNALFDDSFINDETKIMMIDIFNTFGLYSAVTIGEFFDPLRPENIKDIIPYTAKITEFNSWILNSFDKMDDFIKNYISDRINNGFEL